MRRQKRTDIMLMDAGQYCEPPVAIYMKLDEVHMLARDVSMKAYDEMTEEEREKAKEEGYGCFEIASCDFKTKRKMLESCIDFSESDDFGFDIDDEMDDELADEIDSEFASHAEEVLSDIFRDPAQYF